MSLTRNQVKKALAAYDSEVSTKYGVVKWIPIVGSLFKDPIEIKELKDFIQNNQSNLDTPL